MDEKQFEEGFKKESTSLLAWAQAHGRATVAIVAFIVGMIVGHMIK